MPVLPRSARVRVGGLLALTLGVLSTAHGGVPSAAAVPAAPPPPTATPTPTAAPTAAASPTVTLTHEGRTAVLLLSPFALRSPGFEVLVQEPDGRLTPVPAGPERGLVGLVLGDPGAVASAIRRSDGTLAGQVTFADGSTWYFEGAVDDLAVVSVRGQEPPSYRWPGAEQPGRNVTVLPGQVGDQTYRWDIAYDVDASWFLDLDSGAGSIARTLDAVELTTISLVSSFLVGAQLRPAVDRVVIRSSAAASPYTPLLTGPGGPVLAQTRTQWRDAQGPATWDAVAMTYVPDESGAGGGTAYLATAGTDFGVSRNAGRGLQRPLIRHELAHTWGPDDDHTGGPEGQTLLSGNAYDRFDGTELASVLRYRDLRQLQSAPFTPVPRPEHPLPPYAALDLVPDALSGQRLVVDVTANDHDANGDALGWPIVAERSALGGAVSVRDGKLVYVPPAVAAPDTLDRIPYAVFDDSGMAAAGVALVRVDPVPLPQAVPGQSACCVLRPVLSDPGRG